MRIGILGDIHGNMEALTAVVAALRKEGVDEWVQVGDLVGYGPEPSACIDLVRELGCHVCLGNHDAAVLGLLDTSYFNNFARAAIHWTCQNLRPSDLDYLRKLQLTVMRPDYTVVHGTLHMPEQFGYVISPVEALDSLALQTTPFCFVGHSHVPAIYLQRSANPLGQSPASQGLDPSAAPTSAVADDRAGGRVGADADSGAAAEFGDTGETLSPLVAFLTHAALESGDNMAQAGQDAVQLMTVHASKGLEFDAVFITGMEEGLFPHENSQSDRESLEEERRLMYVAITRARKRLYLSHSQSRMLHGQTRFNMKSRFFDELPEACLKWLTPKHAHTARGGMGGGMGAGSGAYHQGWGQGNAIHSGATSARPAGGNGTFGTEVARKQEPAHGLRVKQKVFHAKFGEGTVLTLEGTGDDARAQISFPRHGTKWLALSVAKLTPI